MNMIFFAIFKLFLVIFTGFVLFKSGLCREKLLKLFTAIVIKITVPALIFTNIVTHFNPARSPTVWTFLGLSVAFFVFGALLAMLFGRTVSSAIKREFITLVGFQNCGYLPMNIALFFLAGQLQTTFLNYIFLYILGFNILMWSVASFYIFKRKHEKFRLSSIFTPPIASTVVALVFVYTNMHQFIPLGFLRATQAVGNFSFILSMIVLGGWLSQSSMKMKMNAPVLAKLVLLKLIIIPFVVFSIIVRFKLFSLFGFFLLLQAAMPSAASIPIVVNFRKGNSEFASQGVFVTHLVSLVSFPVWIAFFSQCSGLLF